jgi:hypothetical protein
VKKYKPIVLKLQGHKKTNDISKINFVTQMPVDSKLRSHNITSKATIMLMKFGFQIKR